MLPIIVGKMDHAFLGSEGLRGSEQNIRKTKNFKPRKVEIWMVNYIGVVLVEDGADTGQMVAWDEFPRASKADESW